MKKSIFLFITGIMMSVGLLTAQETPKWIRRNAISPDGTKIAFCYKGDIFVVNTEGGEAIQLTTNTAYDSNPIWTNDSKNIIFSSDRSGADELYITNTKGGTPRKISTGFSLNVRPIMMLSNGRILFSSFGQQDVNYGGFPSHNQLYMVDPNGGKPEMVSTMTIPNISFNKEGIAIYEDYKGYEDPLRKHHTSSVTRDIWMYTPAQEDGKFKITSNGEFKKICDYEGEDRNPVFAADGNTFYYLSEKDGKCFNIYKTSIANPGEQKKLTDYTQNPVRYLSVSDNGILSFSYNGELYTMKSGSEPEKVNITVRMDQMTKDMYKMDLRSGVTSMAVSPNEKEIAVVIRGDVFVTSIDYERTKRITNTASQERNVSFSEDGRTLYYSAERDGCWSIYRATLKNKDDKYFTYAHEIEEELFSIPGETSFQPEVSPDGKWVAYLRDRTELVIKETKGNKVKSLLDVNYSYIDGDLSFAWSPDSKYLLSDYMADGGWNNTDVALIDIKSGKITNLTQSGYTNGNFNWALGGKAITYMSDKLGMRNHGSWGAQYDIYLMFFDGKEYTKFLQDEEESAIEAMMKECAESDEEKKETGQEGEEKKKEESEKKTEPEIKPDLKNRYDRIVRLTPNSTFIADYYLNNDATKIYYIAPTSDNGMVLFVRDLKKGDVKQLQPRVMGKIIPSKDGTKIYVASMSGISIIPLTGGVPKFVKINGEFEYKPREEREYIFHHAWKQVLEKFYDPEIHGIDWEYYRDNYAQFLPYINNDRDFGELLSEMLGELNGSHTGARARRNNMSLKQMIGHLGIFPDKNYEGDGVKIAEVIVNGPINVEDSEIEAGDIITSINGVKIKKGDNWRELLRGRVRKKTFITIQHGKESDVLIPKKLERKLVVTPSLNNLKLLYNRWVKQREKMVEKLSDGKVGYVHVQGMDSPSFREVYSKALGKYRTCEALIVDTRNNGGGWLHDDLATFLNGKAYMLFKPRGKYISTEPYSKWNKPSCVLISEANYSDASGFPYVYRTLGIGKLIGAPVPGTMTAVWWETQINPGIVFGIPQVGSWGLEEQRYLENLQVEPDITVYEDQNAVLEGRDVQLEAAVTEMLKEIKR